MMQQRSGKFIIGLTGNIAVGKSVVRKMLEHVGAFGIDADALSNRAIAVGSPGYQPVVETFGRYILKKDGSIDRSKLGQIVFADPEALAALEAIVHPLVREAVGMLIRKSRAKVIVIEAIKLLESPLREVCDSIWVTTSEPEIQIARLKKNRGMRTLDAMRRMEAQSSQEEKVSQADVVIHNAASIRSTWEQVKSAWKLLFPEVEGDTVPRRIIEKSPAPGKNNKWTIAQARPRQAKMIAEFLTVNGANGLFFTEDDIMEAFGSKAFLLLQAEEGLIALLGWKVENLVASVDSLVWKKDKQAGEIISLLSQEVEEASKELQCEVILIFSDRMQSQNEIYSALGYEAMAPERLNVAAWKEAALDSFDDNHVMFFKALRTDRILRPM